MALIRSPLRGCVAPDLSGELPFHHTGTAAWIQRFSLFFSQFLTGRSRNPGLNPSRDVAHCLFWKLCAAALLILLGVVLCGRLSHPWTFNDDYNGAFWSQAARNFSQAGYLTSAGVPAPLYFGPPPIPPDALYVHHPTLLAGMMFVDRALLGESERAARCLPVFFSLLTAALLWLFVAWCAGRREAAFALAFYVAAPMELHYGQMVNFEAPELFFLLGALCCFHLWRLQRARLAGAGLVICCLLAMWTDWLGYLLVIVLAGRLLVKERGSGAKMAGALVIAAFLSGCALLLQIHLAQPGAWHELFSAFRERSSHADLAGGQFTTAQWLQAQFSYLTSLFNPAAILLAIAGAILAYCVRGRLSAREAAPLQIATDLFFIDAFYVCALRNQSYIHDFASFYYLIPVAIFPAFLIEHILRGIESRWPGYRPAAAADLCSIAAVILIWLGIRSLDNIDTQFCILDDDNSEPATLMPDVGRLIDSSFPADAVIICNFDPYYSPLPYYARREMANAVRTIADWQGAISDAAPRPAAGIIWAGAPDAAELVRHLSRAETRNVTVDGIPFVLWLPQAGPEPLHPS